MLLAWLLWIESIPKLSGSWNFNFDQDLAWWNMLPDSTNVQCPAEKSKMLILHLFSNFTLWRWIIKEKDHVLTITSVLTLSQMGYDPSMSTPKSCEKISPRCTNLQPLGNMYQLFVPCDNVNRGKKWNFTDLANFGLGIVCMMRALMKTLKL